MNLHRAPLKMSGLFESTTLWVSLLWHECNKIKVQNKTDRWAFKWLHKSEPKWLHSTIHLSCWLYAVPVFSLTKDYIRLTHIFFFYVLIQNVNCGQQLNKLIHFFCVEMLQKWRPLHYIHFVKVTLRRDKDGDPCPRISSQYYTWQHRSVVQSVAPIFGL